MKRLFLLLTILLGISAAAQSGKVKVACIGDSITFGYGMKDPVHNSYPAVLQGMLGDGYEVRNYGFSARAMIQTSDRPYMKEKMYADAKAFLPDIAVVMLGTNDVKPENWTAEGYEEAYNIMLGELEALPSHPAIFVCLPAKVHGERWGITDENIVSGTIPVILKVAREHRLKVIDIHTATEALSAHFPDFIHPDEQAAKVIAATVYDALVKAPRASRARPVLRYNFAKSEGNTVRDASGRHLDGELKGSAKLETVDGKKVVNLGYDGGYIDMGPQIGKIIQKAESFTVAVRYFVEEKASLKGNGYFLWTFSTMEQNTYTEGRYHAYKLNIHRSENSVGGWSRETLMDIGKPAEKGCWQTAVYTQDGAFGRLYLNGRLVAVNSQMFTTATTFPDEAPSYNWIGRAAFKGDAFLAGTLIGSVAVYDKALTAAEVRKL